MYMCTAGSAHPKFREKEREGGRERQRKKERKIHTHVYRRIGELGCMEL